MSIRTEKVPDGYRPKCLVISRWGNFLVVFHIMKNPYYGMQTRGWASISDLLFLSPKQGRPCPPKRDEGLRSGEWGTAVSPFLAVSLGASPFQISAHSNLWALLLPLVMDYGDLLGGLLSGFPLSQTFTFSKISKNSFLTGKEGELQ